MHPTLRPYSRSRTWAGLCSLLLALIILAGCGDSNTPTQKPTPPPDQLVNLDLGLPSQALNAPITGSVPDDQVLHIGVTFKIDQAILDQMGNGNSGKSTDTVNANDLAKKLGISDEEYQKAKDFFGVENATFTLDNTHTYMTVDAKASSVARALQTKFVVHTLDKRTFYTPDPKQPPKAPSSIANRVEAITGLDNYSEPPQGKASLNPQSLQSSQQACNPTGKSFQAINSPQSSHAYGYDQLWKNGWHGEGMTINLVEIDSYKQADIDYYATCVGAKNQIKTINIDGPAPAAGAETTLDIQMIAGLAPQAAINVYQTDVSDANKQKGSKDSWIQLNDALRQIINDNTNKPAAAGTQLVSISLGGPESGVTGPNQRAINQSLHLLNKALHMTVFVASGDCGAYMNRIYRLLGLEVSYPASAPYAVAVGGTTLNVDPGNNRSKEVVWSDNSDLVYCQNQWGSGGGISKFFKQPGWQQAAGMQNANGMRQLPDIAAVANNLPIYFEGKWVAVGGTSAATPIWAAGMALVNQGLLKQKSMYYYAPDTFYFALANAGGKQPYYDVTQGDNLYYKAGKGFDDTTGLGAPNLSEFYQVLFNNAEKALKDGDKALN
ncbi:MAG: S8 family serine peptidase [Ktedonobacteraceae bacterium]|nr:S8 family serine peptidase [Ktedonobacteraceae bacterium]